MTNFKMCRCGQCGVRFYSVKRNAKYCSSACRQRHYRNAKKISRDGTSEQFDLMTHIYHKFPMTWNKWYEFIEKVGVTLALDIMIKDEPRIQEFVLSRTKMFGGVSSVDNK